MSTPATALREYGSHPFAKYCYLFEFTKTINLHVVKFLLFPFPLDFESEKKTLLDKKESFDSGNSSIEGTMTSSSSTASSVTQPQEVGESRHHERHIEHELLKNSHPESYTEDSDTGLTSRDSVGTTTVTPPSSDLFPTFQPDSFSSNIEDTRLKSNS